MSGFVDACPSVCGFWKLEVISPHQSQSLSFGRRVFRLHYKIFPPSLHLWWEAACETVNWTMRPERASIQASSMISQISLWFLFLLWFHVVDFSSIFQDFQLVLIFKKGHNIPFIILCIVLERNVSICESMQICFFLRVRIVIIWVIFTAGLFDEYISWCPISY